MPGLQQGETLHLFVPSNLRHKNNALLISLVAAAVLPNLCEVQENLCGRYGKRTRFGLCAKSVHTTPLSTTARLLRKDLRLGFT